MVDIEDTKLFIKIIIVLNHFIAIFCILIGIGYLYIVLYSIFSSQYGFPFFYFSLTVTFITLAIFNIRAASLLKHKSDYLGIKINRILYLVQIGFFTFFIIYHFPHYSWFLSLIIVSVIIVLLSLLMIYYLNKKKKEIKESFEQQ